MFHPARLRAFFAGVFSTSAWCDLFSLSPLNFLLEKGFLQLDIAALLAEQRGPAPPVLV